MTEQMNVPKLRFGEFTAEYIDTTLENLTKKKISYGIVQAGPHIPDGMPYIKSTNLNKELCLDDLERTSDEIAKSYQRSEVLPEDIVFSLRGNIGLTRIVPASIPVANLTQGTARLSIKDSFSNLYVNYCLSTRKIYKRVNSVAKGSTFQEISLADLRNVKVTHSADLPEQQKIASFLSKVDEKIGLLSEKKDKLTEYKRGVMQQLFNGKWHEQDGQLTFVPPTLRFKADDGSAFPDWEKVKLSALATVITKQTGYDYTSTIKPALLNTNVNDSIPFIQNKDFHNLDINLETTFYIPYDVAIKFPKIILDEKCLLITISGKIGNVGVYDQEKLAFIGGAVGVVKFKDKRYIEYINHYLLSPLGQKMIRREIKASSHQNITVEGIRNFILSIPSLSEQSKIGDFLSVIDQKINLANSELNKAKEWKRGLLQQMFV